MRCLTDVRGSNFSTRQFRVACLAVLWQISHDILSAEQPYAMRLTQEPVASGML